MDFHLSLPDVFMLLFVTLGPPLKVPVSYFEATRALEEPEAKALATKAFVFALAAALIGGWVGAQLMTNWHVSMPAMLLATGVVFLLVSLRSVMGEYAPPAAPVVPDPVKPRRTAFGIAVPMLVTPYGMAAIILFVARAWSVDRGAAIAALIVAVMLLNLLAMRYARPILHFIGPIPLQLFGTIVGVLTIGLAMQFLIAGFQVLGLVPGGVALP